MTEDDIPNFVQAIVATGCDICAIGMIGYVIGDGDLPEGHYEQISDELARINEVYRDRDHLIGEIIVYLHSVGRVFESTIPLNWPPADLL